MKTFKEYLTENIKHKFIIDPDFDSDKASLHNFNVDKVESSFSKDKDNYISKGGGANIKDRYPRIQDFLKHNTEIHASSVHVDDSGNIHFNNGRHRYAALRDSGQIEVPMSLHSNIDRKNAKKFGYIN